VRAVVVVVGTPPVIVVRRLDVPVPFVAVDGVLVGIAVAVAVDTVVAGAVGLSGAASFWTCVAANAVIEAREVRVTAVARERRSSDERMSGARSGIGIGQQPRL
jgi:hypothetical protein